MLIESFVAGGESRNGRKRKDELTTKKTVTTTTTARCQVRRSV
jgi:hypothetical protein